MADSAMVSAYFFAQKIEEFSSSIFGGVFKHPHFYIQKTLYKKAETRNNADIFLYFDF